MLYIQLYPFKLFHKLLSCLHLRKEILISLCDMFTGPYKDGLKNTRDYCCFAGFYLFLRIIVLYLYFVPGDEDNNKSISYFLYSNGIVCYVWRYDISSI